MTQSAAGVVRQFKPKPDLEPSEPISLADSTLSDLEKSRKYDLEKQLQSEEETKLQSGGVYREIRDSRLYRDEYPTFDQYCMEKWNYSPRHINRLIAAFVAVDEMGPMGPKVCTYRHALELSYITNVQQRVEVWEKVNAQAKQKGHPVTFTMIADAKVEETETPKKKPLKSKLGKKSPNTNSPAARWRQLLVDLRTQIDLIDINDGPIYITFKWTLKQREDYLNELTSLRDDIDRIAQNLRTTFYQDDE